MTRVYNTHQSDSLNFAFPSQTFSPYLPLHPTHSQKVTPIFYSHTCAFYFLIYLWQVSFLLMFNCGKIHIKLTILTISKCAVQLNKCSAEYAVEYIHSDIV